VYAAIARSGTAQISLLYAFREAPAYADHLALPQARPTPFPARRQMELLERLELMWRTRLSLERKQSSRGTDEPKLRVDQIADVLP
jgi:hypothetical protein